MAIFHITPKGKIAHNAIGRGCMHELHVAIFPWCLHASRAVVYVPSSALQVENLFCLGAPALSRALDIKKKIFYIFYCGGGK